MFLFLFNLIILTNYLYFYSNSKTILAFLLCIPINSTKESPNQMKTVNNWLYFFTIVISFLGVSLFIIVLNFLNAKYRITFQNDWNFMISLVYIGIFLLVFGLILFPQILYGIPVIRTSLFNKVNESPSSVKDKVENISFDLDYIKKINFLLNNWIKEKKYLDLESSTFGLSKDIDLPLHHVTYFFNNVNDDKYIEWRSRLRVLHAISLINSEKGYVKTIESLGKESGFKSYATFIQSFNRDSGKLPNDYIKDLNS
jgi:AraC-like DNA-binding protein